MIDSTTSLPKSRTFAEVHPEMTKSLTLINTLNPIQFKQNMTLSQFTKSYYMYFQQLPFLPQLFAGLDDALWVRELFRRTSMTIDIQNMDICRRQMLDPLVRGASVCYYKSLFDASSGWGSVRSLTDSAHQEDARLKTRVLIIWVGHLAHL